MFDQIQSAVRFESSKKFVQGSVQVINRTENQGGHGCIERVIVKREIFGFCGDQAVSGIEPTQLVFEPGAHVSIRLAQAKRGDGSGVILQVGPGSGTQFENISLQPVQQLPAPGTETQVFGPAHSGIVITGNQAGDNIHAKSLSLKRDEVNCFARFENWTTMPRKPSNRQIEIRYRKDRQRNALAIPGPHDFIVVLDRLKAGYNVPKILRSAQAFGAAEVHLIDVGIFDPAPAKGALRKVPARFPGNFAESHADLQKRGYDCFLLVADGDERLGDFELPRRSAFVFGHEEFGPSFDRQDFPDIRTLKIPQYGQMESLNVSNAASIVMFEYVRQWGRKGDGFRSTVCR